MTGTENEEQDRWEYKQLREDFFAPPANDPLVIAI